MKSSFQDKNTDHKKILVIDDDSYICDLLANFLIQKGFSVDSSYTGRGGIKLISQNRYDLVISDYRLPDLDGLKILENIKRVASGTNLIIMTAYSDVRMAVKLIKEGVIEYVTKPIQPDEILAVIQKAFAKQENKEEPESNNSDFIIGIDENIHKILKHIDAVAPTDMTVLIEGETGSGKEYLAREIHKKSKRHNMNFMAVDCGALPKELASSELFGHIKGSFTGAINDKSGYFEQANGGTLFLDEIGNLPHEIQVKLLRALQEKVINRVGDTKSIRIDVRIIAATNDDLFSRVENNEFREDLYHRINGFKIVVPPLRKRKNDIFIFAENVLKEANAAFGKNIKGFSDEVKDIFSRYPWYGNIRELENVVKRCTLLEDSDYISTKTLPDEIRFDHLDSRDTSSSGNMVFDEVKDLKAATHLAQRSMIINVLKETNYNKTKAAKLLRIDRKTLYNKIKEYEIELNH